MSSKCLINDKKFQWGTVGSGDIRCVLTQFSYILYTSRFQYVCLGSLFIIILISIFGKIKETYRWLILNQAIWDVILTYSYICGSFLGYAYLGEEHSCFYLWKYDYGNFFTFIVRFTFEYIETNYYSALLLLTMLQACCVYFRDFYNRLTKNRRILWVILGVNGAFIGTTLGTGIWVYLLVLRSTELDDECEANNGTCKPPEADPTIQFYKTAYLIFQNFNLIKPPLCMLLSLIAAIFTMTIVVKQAKFRLRHNKSDFYGSLRVATVLLLQCSINFGVFLLEISNRAMTLWVLSGLPRNDELIIFIYGIASSEIIEGLRQLRVFLGVYCSFDNYDGVPRSCDQLVSGGIF